VFIPGNCVVCPLIFSALHMAKTLKISPRLFEKQKAYSL
jgi:hypothetical protein